MLRGICVPVSRPLLYRYPSWSAGLWSWARDPQALGPGALGETLGAGLPSWWRMSSIWRGGGGFEIHAGRGGGRIAKVSESRRLELTISLLYRHGR
jgi:hypothetical protein